MQRLPPRRRKPQMGAVRRERKVPHLILWTTSGRNYPKGKDGEHQATRNPARQRRATMDSPALQQLPPRRYVSRRGLGRLRKLKHKQRPTAQGRPW